MNVNVLICFLSYFALSAVSCAFIHQGIREKAIRTSLLDNVERRNTWESPLILDNGDATERKLGDFSPYFVTADAELNEMIGSLLENHFHESANISDPKVYDELELMTLKVFFEKEKFTGYPQQVLQYILCFFHEMIYGINAIAPANTNSAKVSFIRKLYKYDLPKSFEYLVSLERPDLTEYPGLPENSKNIWNLEQWRESLRFFYERPGMDAVKTVASVRINPLHLNSLKPEEFQVILTERIHPFFHDEEFLFYCILSNAGSNSFSPEMFHWYKQLNGNKITLKKSMPGFYDFRLKFEYFKAIKESLAPTDQLHEVLNTIIKLFGCNSVDRFSLEQFKSMDAAPLLKEIVDFTHSSNFTLAQLEMFSELVSSEIFTPEMIQKLHRETIRSSSQLLQHIIEFETDKMI